MATIVPGGLHLSPQERNRVAELVADAIVRGSLEVLESNSDVTPINREGEPTLLSSSATISLEFLLPNGCRVAVKLDRRLGQTYAGHEIIW